MISLNLTIHNKDFLLKEVLDGIKSNTISNYELVLVLDGCSDESENIVNNFIANNPKIKIIKLYAPNVFETKANNIAAKNSSGDYLIIIQDDMIIKEKGWDARMLKPIKEFSDIFAVTSRTAHNWIINPYSVDIKKDILDEDRWADMLIHIDHADKKSIPRNVFAVRNCVNRGPLLIKHDILNKLNYFDEIYSPQDMDEHDLCYRAKKIGYKCGCYWIDFVSEDSWGGTRENGKPKKWLLDSNFKNGKIFINRYKDELNSNCRTIENRKI